MKNKNKDIGLVSSGGICIDGDILLSCEHDHSSNSYLFLRIALAFTATLCTALMAEFFIGSGVMGTVLLYYSLISTLAFGLMKSKHSIIRICAAAVALLQAGYVAVMFDNIRTGFFVIADDYLSKANQPNPLGIYLNGVNSDDYATYASFFYIALILLISLGTVAACVYRIDFPLLFIITFPVFELGMYWGWEVPSITVIGLIICWIIALAMHIINHTTNKAGRKNTFAIHERKKTFFFTSSSAKARFYPVFMSFVCILTAVVFISVVIFSTVTGFVRTEKMDDLRKDISTSLSSFSISDIENAFSDYDGGLDFFSVKTVGGTNGGILGESEGISFNGSTALKLDTPKFVYTMYLKGYAAGDYHDNKWTPIENDLNEYDFYDTMKKEGYWPQDWNYAICKSKENSSLDNNLSSMTINVKGASKKFVYAPYGSLFTSGNEGSGDMKPNGESYVKAGTAKYEMDFYNFSAFNDSDWTNIVSFLEVMPNHFNVKSAKADREYSEFVSKNYLKTEDSEALNKAYREVCDYLYKDVNTYYDVYYAIKKYFSDNYTYTLTPGATPEGEDFIDYFLAVQKEGYCSYFASAGVELLRMFGFPARYAEGYMVLPSQLGDTPNEDGLYEVAVKDKSAHAWAEVYIENVGWVPAEFTPGYDEGNPNLTDEEKNPSSETSVTTTTKTTESSISTEKTTTTKKQSRVTKKTSDNNSSSKSSDNSSADSRNGSANKSATDDKNNNDNKPTSSAIKYTIFTFVMILLICFIVAAHRQAKLKKMHEECRDKDLNKRVVNIYKYALMYLSLAGVSSKKNVTDIQLAEILNDKCREKNLGIPEEKLKELAEIAAKGYLSDSEITPDEAQQAKEILSLISDETVRSKLSAAEMFAAKYIHCLY